MLLVLSVGLFVRRRRRSWSRHSAQQQYRSKPQGGVQQRLRSHQSQSPKAQEDQLPPSVWDGISFLSSSGAAALTPKSNDDSVDEELGPNADLDHGSMLPLAPSQVKPPMSQGRAGDQRRRFSSRRSRSKSRRARRCSLKQSSKRAATLTNPEDTLTPSLPSPSRDAGDISEGFSLGTAGSELPPQARPLPRRPPSGTRHKTQTSIGGPKRVGRSHRTRSISGSKSSHRATSSGSGRARGPRSQSRTKRRSNSRASSTR